MRRYVILFLILFILFFYSKNQPVDLSKYQSSYKQIEVKGEVKKPGTYEVEKDANIETILEVAGGVLASGDISHLNLNHNIENHGVIVVRELKEPRKISINSATLEELDELNGVGPAIANRIIEYRNQKPFSTLEELMEVKGIGQKMFDKIKDMICL